MQLNVYDFDRTIYDGDSAIDFYFFCLRRKPGLLRFAPLQLFAGVCYMAKKLSQRDIKEHFFCFLRGIDEDELSFLLAAFWRKNESKIKSWYLAKDHSRDVVISASAEFLLRPLAQKYGIARLIATQVDPRTGKVSGSSCYGRKKVQFFTQHYPKGEIAEFYSDSFADRPLAVMAQRAYKVKGDRVYSWK